MESVVGPQWGGCQWWPSYFCQGWVPFKYWQNNMPFQLREVAWLLFQGLQGCLRHPCWCEFPFYCLVNYDSDVGFEMPPPCSAAAGAQEMALFSQDKAISLLPCIVIMPWGPGIFSWRWRQQGRAMKIMYAVLLRMAWYELWIVSTSNASFFDREFVTSPKVTFRVTRPFGRVDLYGMMP